MEKFDYSYIGLGNGGIIQREMLNRGYKVICFGWKFKIPNFLLIARLTLFFQKERPDVVHTSGAEANFHGIWAARLAQIPCIIAEEIGIPNHGKITRILFRITYWNVNKVIAVSTMTRDWIIQSKECSPNKVVTIHNPANVPEVTLPLIPKKNFTFVISCRVAKIKNLSLVFEAMKLLRQENLIVDFWIVGDGPEKLNLENHAREKGIIEQVKFWGFQANPGIFIKSADAFILPSFSEGFSIALLEAMSLEVPCLATKFGGASEVIEEGINGFLLDPKDLKQCYEKMRAIYSLSPSERRKIGLSGAETARTRFSPNVHIEAVEKLYTELMHG